VGTVVKKNSRMEGDPNGTDGVPSGLSGGEFVYLERVGRKGDKRVGGVEKDNKKRNTDDP